MKATCKPFYLVVILLIINNAIAMAQPSLRYNLKGVVIDSASRKPVEMVTATLTTENGRTIARTTTDVKGAFTFAQIEKAHYTLKINAIGYQPEEIVVAFTGSTPTTLDLKEVMLIPQTSSLKQVAVTASKLLVKQEADRIIYDLQADADSKSNNLLSMMRKIPFLSVDGSDNLLLKGQADFKVFINGKPSSMMERNLKGVLQSMPAASIQKIEVITNPPSKYDAEGLAGIINIITIKNTTNGYNGNINLSERYPAGGPDMGGSLNLRQQKVDISGFGGVSLYDKPLTDSYNSRIGTGGSSSLLLQNGAVRSKVPGGYLGSEISYNIDTLTLLSVQWNINGDRTQEYNSLRSALNNGTTLAEAYLLDNKKNNDSFGWDAGVNYQLGFTGDKNRLLTFAYRYLTYQSTLNSDVTLTDRLNYPVPDFTQNNKANLNEHTLQADYVHPLKKVTIEAGIKGIVRQNESEYSYLSAGTSANNALDSYYRSSQYIWALYNSYQFQLKGWSLKAGLRLELTYVDADFVSDAQQVNQRYLNLVPNITAGKKLTDYSSVNFGFSQRIKRPGINKLNPFVDRSNPAFESSGNPGLIPSVIDNLQTGYIYNSNKTGINLGVSYSWVKNIALQIASFDSQTQITRTTYENAGKARALDGNLSLRHTISKAWTFNLNSHASMIWLTAVNNGNLVQNNWVIYNAAISSGYNLDKDWRLSANLNLISRNIVNLQGRTNGLVSSSFGASKEIIKNKLSLAGTVNNPFSKYRNNITTTQGDNFLQTSIVSEYFRQYNISLNYRFGKLKASVNKSLRGIKNDDLSN